MGRQEGWSATRPRRLANERAEYERGPDELGLGLLGAKAAPLGQHGVHPRHRPDHDVAVGGNESLQMDMEDLQSPIPACSGLPALDRSTATRRGTHTPIKRTAKCAVVTKTRNKVRASGQPSGLAKGPAVEKRAGRSEPAMPWYARHTRQGAAAAIATASGILTPDGRIQLRERVAYTNNPAACE